MTHEALDHLSQLAQIYRDLCERKTGTTREAQGALDQLERIIYTAVMTIEIETT